MLPIVMPCMVRMLHSSCVMMGPSQIGPGLTRNSSQFWIVLMEDILLAQEAPRSMQAWDSPKMSSKLLGIGLHRCGRSIFVTIPLFMPNISLLLFSYAIAETTHFASRTHLLHHHHPHHTQSTAFCSLSLESNGIDLGVCHGSLC